MSHLVYFFLKLNYLFNLYLFPWNKLNKRNNCIFLKKQTIPNQKKLTSSKSTVIQMDITKCQVVSLNQGFASVSNVDSTFLKDIIS